MASKFVADEDVIPEVKRNPWVDYGLRPLLLTGMITCLSIAVVNIVKISAPQWHGTYLLVGMILVTVEAIYSYQILRRTRPIDLDPVRFRLVEWGILLILLKILSYAGQPWTVVLNDLKSVAGQPWQFFSPGFWNITLLAMLAWMATTGTLKDFEDLYDPFTFRTNDVTPYLNLRARFFWGGAFLVFVSGLTVIVAQSGFEGLVDFNRPRVGGIIVNVMVYFLLGLVILSQAQLTMLLTRWEIQKVEVAPGLVKQWVKYGLIVLSLVTLAVLMLPTSYTLGFLASANLVLASIIGVVVFIFRLLIFLFTLPFLFLASLFMGEGMTAEPPQPPPMQPAPSPEALAGGSGLPWFEIVRSIIFWIIVLAIIIYLVRTYLKDHPELLQMLKEIKWFRLSFGWLNSIWKWLRGFVRAGIELLPKRVEIATPTDGRKRQSRWRWPRMGAMSAKEQILYYYLSILKRAERAGLARRKDQTPDEFAPKLGDALPDVEPEIGLLTEAFVHARYSQDSFDYGHASLVRTIWQQIKNAFRKIIKQESRPDSD